MSSSVFLPLSKPDVFPPTSSSFFPASGIESLRSCLSCLQSPQSSRHFFSGVTASCSAVVNFSLSAFFFVYPLKNDVFFPETAEGSQSLNNRTLLARNEKKNQTQTNTIFFICYFDELEIRTAGRSHGFVRTSH